MAANNRHFNETRQVQRFGLRKLGVGVVSVLLGVTLFAAMGTTQVSADSATAQVEKQTKDQDKAAVSENKEETTVEAVDPEKMQNDFKITGSFRDGVELKDATNPDELKDDVDYVKIRYTGSGRQHNGIPAAHGLKTVVDSNSKLAVIYTNYQPGSQLAKLADKQIQGASYTFSDFTPYDEKQQITLLADNNIAAGVYLTNVQNVKLAVKYFYDTDCKEQVVFENTDGTKAYLVLTGKADAKKQNDVASALIALDKATIEYEFDFSKDAKPKDSEVWLRLTTDIPKDTFSKKTTTKHVHEVIDYVDENGNAVAKPVKASQDVTSESFLNKKGETTWQNDPVFNFAAVKSPTVEGYSKPDPENVAAVSGKFSEVNAGQVFNNKVVYTKLKKAAKHSKKQEQIVIKNETPAPKNEVVLTPEGAETVKDTPVHAIEFIDLKDEAHAEAPKEAIELLAARPAVAVKAVTSHKEVKKAAVKPAAKLNVNNEEKQSAAELPQTGNEQNKAGLAGLALAAGSLLLGSFGKIKKH